MSSLQDCPAIILARSGSKGIPRKNLVPFCGRPLLSWTIEYAHRSACVSGVWVSTDCEHIARVAEKDGARIIWRPGYLASDTSSSESGWIHAKQDVPELGIADVLIALQATSPLRLPRDLDLGIRRFRDMKLDSLFSASLLDDLTLWEVSAGGSLQPVNQAAGPRKPRQFSSQPIVENGSFYIFTGEGLVSASSRFFGDLGYSANASWQMHEIDSAESLKTCEALMKHFVIPAFRRAGWS